VEVEGEVMPQMLLIFVNDIGFEQNKKYQGLLLCVCVFACCVLLSTSKHFLIGSGAEVTVYKL